MKKKANCTTFQNCTVDFTVVLFNTKLSFFFQSVYWMLAVDVNRTQKCIKINSYVIISFTKQLMTFQFTVLSFLILMCLTNVPEIPFIDASITSCTCTLFSSFKIVLPFKNS